MMQQRLFKIAALLGALLMFEGCANVTIRPKGSTKIGDNPTWSESKSFFFWGLVGKKVIDVTEVCGNRQVLQMQTQLSFLDGFLGFITLGIYSPRTARIWCAKDSAKETG